MHRSFGFAGALALALATVAAQPVEAADLVVTMSDLAIRPTAYIGQHVVIPDCFMISYYPTTGAQCSLNPIDYTALVYVDSDTWSAQARKVADDCETAIIALMCTLKVTGDVSINRRDQALILHATLEIVKRPQQAL